MRGDAESRRLAGRLHTGAATMLALAIFALDVLSPLQGAVAVLYTTVILIAARSHSRAMIVTAGLFCTTLALVGYSISHWSDPLGSPAMRLAVSLTAIAITTILSIRNLSAADARRRSDLRYRTIFNAAGLAIWESDWTAAHALMRNGDHSDPQLAARLVRATRILDANQASARLFGLADRRDMTGNRIAGHSTPAAEATLVRIIAALMRGESEIEEETQFLNAAGEAIDVLLRVTLPPGEDGWSRVLVMAIDLTERKRAQLRLAQSQAELTHMARVTTLGQLAASIAHEVNQPLSAIITYAKSGRRWLAQEAPDAAEVGDCLDRIAANGTRAADVIARIRNIARKADPRQDRLALAPLIDETIALLQRDLQTNDVEIRVSVAPGLPEVTGDRVQIQQVLMNLLLNAEQAMVQTDCDARLLRVDVTGDVDGAIIAVVDCGPGVGDDPETLFSPFFTTKAEGLGMGLSICRSIIEQHGGALTAANNGDRGATFRFRLPFADSSREHDA